MEVSIIIPVYNEEASVEPLAAALGRALDDMEGPAEVLLVDDGSTDDTFAQACAQVRRDERFTVVRLNDNFGQTAALGAGIERADGRILVTMDGDLQNDPQDVKQLVHKLRDGYDVVAGYRSHRTESFLLRALPSRIANGLIRVVTGTSVRDNGCTLRAYRAGVLRRMPLYSEMHRLLPTILAMAGARLAQVEVAHHPRRHGVSKYGLGRVYKVLVDLLTLKILLTAGRRPLFGFGKLAVLSGGLAGGAVVWGCVHQAAHPGASMVVFLGAGLLWGALGLSLLMLGAVAALVYSRGMLKMEDLLEVKTLPEGPDSGTHG